MRGKYRLVTPSVTAASAASARCACVAGGSSAPSGGVAGDSSAPGGGVVGEGAAGSPLLHERVPSDARHAASRACHRQNIFK